MKTEHAVCKVEMFLPRGGGGGMMAGSVLDHIELRWSYTLYFQKNHFKIYKFWYFIMFTFMLALYLYFCRV